jgi:thiol-disulfide isomerase/thioredoxin
MRRFLVSVCASCFVVASLLTTAGNALAQSRTAQESQPKVEATNATVAPASPSREAGALYEDASKYVERKFEEFRRTRVPYNSALATKTYEEQRELAARHAAALAARSNLAGADHYYLGMLYDLAGKTPEAIEPLRRFLAASPAEGTKEQRQNARLTLGAEAAALKRFDEAEQLLADYARSDPATPQGLFKLHHALARAYLSNKKLEQSAAHARTAYRIAKESPVKAGDELSRAQVIASAGEFLADALVDLKKEREAAETMQDLLRLGLSLPSAHVFTSAARWLAQNDEEELIGRVLGEKPPTPDAASATAPEIDIAEWIDQKPLKLADLRGRVVILDFWATWCAPCRFTMPKLKSLQERFKRDGLVVIGLTQFFGRAEKTVVTPPEELAYLRSYKKDLKLPYAFAVANDSANNMRYGVHSLPTAFVIDRRGRVRYIAVGASEADDGSLIAFVEKLLAEQP